MFKSHLIKSTHRVLSKTEQMSMEHQFLHLITAPLFSGQNVHYWVLKKKKTF
jgi:hypothetical protein